MLLITKWNCNIWLTCLAKFSYRLKEFITTSPNDVYLSIDILYSNNIVHMRSFCNFVLYWIVYVLRYILVIVRFQGEKMSQFAPVVMIRKLKLKLEQFYFHYCTSSLNVVYSFNGKTLRILTENLIGYIDQP